MNNGKLNSKRVNNSASDVWRSEWSSVLQKMRRVTFSGRALTAHSACLPSSSYLYSTAAAVLRGHPTVLASPDCWGLCSWAAPSPLLESLFRNFNPVTRYQALTSLHNLFKLGSSVTTEAASSWCQADPWPLCAFKPRTIWGILRYTVKLSAQGTAMASLSHRFCVLALRNTSLKILLPRCFLFPIAADPFSFGSPEPQKFCSNYWTTWDSLMDSFKLPCGISKARPPLPVLLYALSPKFPRQLIKFKVFPQPSSKCGPVCHSNSY